MISTLQFNRLARSYRKKGYELEAWTLGLPWTIGVTKKTPDYREDGSEYYKERTISVYPNEDADIGHIKDLIDWQIWEFEHEPETFPVSGTGADSGAGHTQDNGDGEAEGAAYSP